MTITDQTRQGALKLINRIRSRVASGEFQAKNHFPSASDMEAMRWDCILETIAERALLNCPENPLPVSAAHGQNYRL
ncbi:hypothetical protein KIN20_019664 [Parelaphostrongylus tenuis]|uniref:Uncharacterized protein n=1 Tax=Parelaphostrongylus tenuis TaxID=148309 RepID=A0AAD5QT10_PARTN|nr:hypothetical protein KIN20_019664 [Parelaphostrongylus tenuis]